MNAEKPVSIRKVTGTKEKPQLYITKELKKINATAGDFVAIRVVDGKIVITKVTGV